MGSLSYYVEAFVEEPSLGYRWRVWNNGEGSIEFAYQEFKDGQWLSRTFQGIPADSTDKFIAAITAVKDSPV
jgi:hypothetical protein